MNSPLASQLTEEECESYLAPGGFGLPGYTGEQEDELLSQSETPYWLPFTKKKGFVRLHISGACSIMPGKDVTSFK